MLQFTVVRLSPKVVIVSCVISMLLAGKLASAQTLPVGTPVLEDALRRKQVKGDKRIHSSFAIRPIHASEGMTYDSLLHPVEGIPAKQSPQPSSFANGKGEARLMPFVLQQQFNSHHPFGWNDGAMIPAKGYQAKLSFGAYSKLGPLRVQLQPEVVYANNPAFPTFSSQNDTTWSDYVREVVNLIDAPESFGFRAYVKLFPGQSSIRLNFKKLSFGLSTENLWWGPGVRNSLLMSNNAPGFPHFTFNTTSPLSSPIGSFEAQLISGLLDKSGVLPSDTARTLNGEKVYLAKPEGSRYINGVNFNWHPKWVPGLYVGLSRVFYMYRHDVPTSLGGYLPVIGQLFKGNNEQIEREDAINRDQLLSIYFRLLLPKEKAELYGELGRNDHSGNMRDFLLEPEHSRAYTIGFRKLFDAGKDSEVELLAEVTNLQRPATSQLRGSPTWYIHHSVRDGYTNRGQILGAGIGPGASSQTIGISKICGIGKTGAILERVVFNNDFYYQAARPTGNYWGHRVDYAIQLNRSWQHKNFLYDARLSWIHSLNYQWQQGKDTNNISAALAVSYLF